MFFGESKIRVLYWREPVDMRKSFLGLYSLVKNTLLEDPLSGDLFVFCNRGRNYVKGLYFDRTGVASGRSVLRKVVISFQREKNGSEV